MNESLQNPDDFFNYTNDHINNNRGVGMTNRQSKNNEPTEGIGKSIGYHQNVEGRAESPAVEAYDVFRRAKKKTYLAFSENLVEELPFATSWLRKCARKHPKSIIGSIARDLDAWENKYDWANANPYTFFTDIKHTNREKFNEIFTILTEFYDEIQVNNSYLISNEENDPDNFIRSEVFNTGSLLRPGQVTYCTGINGTGKTNLSVWIMLQISLMRFAPDMETVVMTNIGLSKSTFEKYGIHQVSSLSEIIEIIGDYLSKGKQAYFIAFIDELDNQLAASDAGTRKLATFMKFTYQIRKFSLSLFCVVHYQKDINKAHRSNSYAYVLKGQWFPVDSYDMSEAVKLSIEEGLTCAAAWTEEGYHNISQIPDMGSLYDTEQNTTLKIDIDVTDLFEKLAALPPIDFTLKAKLDRRIEKGKIIIEHLENLKSIQEETPDSDERERIMYNFVLTEKEKLLSRGIRGFWDSLGSDFRNLFGVEWDNKSIQNRLGGWKEKFAKS